MCGLYLLGSPSCQVAKVGFSSDITGRFRRLKTALNRAESSLGFLGLDDSELQLIAQDFALIGIQSTDSMFPLSIESNCICLMSQCFQTIGRSNEWFFVAGASFTDIREMLGFLPTA